MSKRKLYSFTLAAALAGFSGEAFGQRMNSSLFQPEMPRPMVNQPGLGGPYPLYDPSGSWIRTPVLPPKEIRVHDLVSIRVEELSRSQSESAVQRRKNALFNAVLLDWLKLDGLSINKAPQAQGDPRIKGQLDETYRTQGDVLQRESLTFNIAAEVVDIRPNGTLVLEAHKELHERDDAWDYSLTGICRKEDINPNNVILSRDIAHLRIDKQSRGHSFDSHNRGWLLRWIDQVRPF
jgi:flagellar L-ring protein precursor FlgH